MRRNAMNEAPESQDQYRCTTIEVSIELPHSYEVLSHSLIFFFFFFFILPTLNILTSYLLSIEYPSSVCLRHQTHLTNHKPALSIFSCVSFPPSFLLLFPFDLSSICWFGFRAVNLRSLLRHTASVSPAVCFRVVFFFLSTHFRLFSSLELLLYTNCCWSWSCRVEDSQASSSSSSSPPSLRLLP